MESVEAERDFHLSDKEENLLKHKEEMEKLMTLSQKSDLLREELREEKEQLEVQLQHNINMVCGPFL